MAKLKELQEKIILEAVKKAIEKSADEPKKDFTKKDRKGKSLFSMVPYALLFNECVTMMDIGVYAIILGYCIRNDVTSIRISQKEIADVLETSSQIISRSILVLESLDWLEIEHRVKATSTYCPRETETLKARQIRLSETKSRRKKKSRLQELFLKQIAEAEEARKNLIKWFKSLSDEEAIKFYEENSDLMDYINEENSKDNLPTHK